jgi:hypothetical protein
LPISYKYFKKLQNILKNREKEKNIKNLPDISDLGRSVKKYNL